MITQLNAQATGLAAPAHSAPRLALSVATGIRLSARG
ncbi:hypothetical protein SRABI76_00067 [Microbacterium oxydans]|uniref:Uncharacterized protein n=1 Tax=Microbacterium oxydans TaxID=82380 RepID=A0A0F0L701_9MICO|nr:hypothetical protein RS83_03155 [Microbacterium oxydans]CAH0123846.1 hypothetical protein SRABI76_00067 [Microbacterium oxydans]